jgi:hypothetical protein
MAGVRAVIHDSDDRILLTSKDRLFEVLDAAAAEASAQSLLNVVTLTAENGNELTLVVGSAETVVGFTDSGLQMLHYASVGAAQTMEPVLTAYVGLRHHTEFPRRYVIPSAHGIAAASEFLDTGMRPSSVTWEVA